LAHDRNGRAPPPFLAAHEARSMMTLYTAWLRYLTDSWELGLEAQTVVGLRLAKLAAGDAAALSEAHQMVSEKILAAAEVQMKTASAVLSGQSHRAPAAALAHYRRKVRANRRRLSR
jgi:hypothetical protein